MSSRAVDDAASLTSHGLAGGAARHILEQVGMVASHVCVLEPAHAPVRHLFDLRGYAITQCGACGLIMTGATVQDVVSEHEVYYTLRHDRVEDVYTEWAFRWRWILRRLGELQEAGDLLDVGAGNGLFVKIAAQEFGWRARGVEISQQSIRFAKRVLDVDLEETDFTTIPQTFDLVTCFNLIEHLIDPVAMIRQLGERLRPGGFLAISTPSPACLQARLKGLPRWTMVSPPHHVNLFSREALQLALSKAGFEVVRHDTISTYINALRRIEKRGTRLRRVAFEGLRLSGLGGDHLIIARKA